MSDHMILRFLRIDEIQSILMMTCTRNYVVYLISYFCSPVYNEEVINLAVR